MTTRPSLLKITTPIQKIHEDQLSVGPLTVAGWVRTRRSSKKFSFLEINDGTCAQSLQVILNASLENYTAIEKLTTGCSVVVHGNLVLSPAQGQKYELQGCAVEILGLAPADSYPLQKKEMTLEFLRDNAHLRMRTATFSSLFRLRSRVSFAIHRFFQEQGFSLVHTPLLTTADGEGAGESFKVTQLDLLNVPKTPSGQVDFSKDFFEEMSMLCVTGQLEAELMLAGLNKVYTFGPTFRAENSNTSRHLAEFWMIEPEVAFADLWDNMDLAQSLIQTIVKDVLEHSSADLDVCRQKADQDSRSYLQTVLEKSFVRVSYTEAVGILEKSGVSFEHPVFWGCDLKSEHERFLCETHFKAPTIVYDYPEANKAFYMYLNDDGKTVRAMDILMPGIGEVVGGSEREHREDVLRERMIAKGTNTQHMDWYVSSRRFGTIPHAGFGLGLERLLVWISGMGNVRDVIPFPRTPGRCWF